MKKRLLEKLKDAGWYDLLVGEQIAEFLTDGEDFAVTALRTVYVNARKSKEPTVRFEVSITIDNETIYGYSSTCFKDAAIDAVLRLPSEEAVEEVAS